MLILLPAWLGAIGRALGMGFAMAWQVLWALVLGFALSAVVQAVVSKGEVRRLLPDDSPGSLARASLLGAASSSCSYAAVALARSLFRQGADFTAAIAFEIASTNLVIELGILLALLLGWQFTLAEFVAGPLMIVLLALMFRAWLRPGMIEAARRQADLGIPGRMEGHAAMDMAVTEGPLWRRLRSDRGRTAVSHYFVMDLVMVWPDVVGGLLLAGALAAWVPREAWQALFLADHPQFALWWGPLVGPAVAVLSFVCSVGNVPLAAVLWNGGISFGGVVAFILADLLIVPILDIYRRYYGRRMALFLFGTFYLAMAVAGLVIEFGFQALGLVPAVRQARVVQLLPSWNYTTVLNLGLGLVAALLLVRFLRTGGPRMLRMMGQAPPARTASPGHEPGQGGHHHA